MERIESKTIHDGKLISLRADVFRHEDGETAEREVVSHPGAVAMIAHDDERFWMVRQPREAVGEESLLELPAGNLDSRGRDAAGVRQARAGRGGRPRGRELARAEAHLHQPWLHRRAGADLRRQQADAGRSAAVRGREDRDRRDPAGRARRDDRSPAATPSRWSGCCFSAPRADGPTSVAGEGGARRPAETRRHERDRGARARHHDGGAGRALRGPCARLSRLPGARAGAVPEHPQRLPHRPAPVRHLSRRARRRRPHSRAQRRGRVPGRAGDRQRRPALHGVDDPSQGRLPALLLQAPAPRGDDRRRPDRRPGGTAADPQAAPRPQLLRGPAPACRAARRRADGDARPRPARGDVRLRAAGIGDDRARALRARPAARLPARPRQGLQGAPGPTRHQGGGGGQRLSARVARSWSASARRQSSSSTSAAGR